MSFCMGKEQGCRTFREGGRKGAEAEEGERRGYSRGRGKEGI
jgi:hypothetical protein